MVQTCDYGGGLDGRSEFYEDDEPLESLRAILRPGLMR